MEARERIYGQCCSARRSIFETLLDMPLISCSLSGELDLEPKLGLLF